MSGKSSEESMLYYKNRVLNFIINNQTDCGAMDISKIFGLSKRRIQDFVKEYNDMGFNIISRKQKYIIKKFPADFEMIKGRFKRQDIRKYTLYNQIKKSCGKSRKINRKEFVACESGPGSLISTNESYIQKMIQQLEKEGLIFTRNGFIHVPHDLLETFEDEEILRLLIYLNVMKNLYPRGNYLREVFTKLIFEYRKRGYDFNEDAVVYPHRSRISLYDEIVLEVIEEAISSGNSIEFRYKLRNRIEYFNEAPSGIIYNSWKDMWYFIASGDEDKVYRLDRILDIKIVEGSCGKFRRDLYEYSVGISNEEIVEVEVLFIRDDFIYKKLLWYIKQRKTASLEMNDKGYILRDRVCGIKEFKRWVRSFGDSAFCLKPRELVDEIVSEIKVMRERYGGN